MSKRINKQDVQQNLLEIQHVQRTNSSYKIFRPKQRTEKCKKMYIIPQLQFITQENKEKHTFLHMPGITTKKTR